MLFKAFCNCNKKTEYAKIHINILKMAIDNIHKMWYTLIVGDTICTT